MKDDPDTNVCFVQTIEGYPCLYDHSRADYCNKDTQDKAWADIGTKFDATVSQCKERWKNLRACYTRHLKVKPASGSATKFKKPYYLAEYLNILEPFTKSRKQSGNMSKLLPENNCEQEFTANLSENEYEEDYEKDQTDQLKKDSTSNKVPDASTSSFIEPSSKLCISSPIVKKKRIGLDDVNKAAHDFFFTKKKKTEPVVEDSDLSFFKSVLPDMKCMTPNQKRRFKVGVLNLSDSILNEQNMSQGVGVDIQNYHSGLNTQYQNIERSSNPDVPPSMSSTSGSTNPTPPLNLARPPKSSHIYSQDWTYHQFK